MSNDLLMDALLTRDSTIIEQLVELLNKHIKSKQFRDSFIKSFDAHLEDRLDDSLGDIYAFDSERIGELIEDRVDYSALAKTMEERITELLTRSIGSKK